MVNSERKSQIGKNLRRLRKRANMTQERLADISGLSVDFISLIERGLRSPSVETLDKLAVALEAKITDFFQVEK